MRVYDIQNDAANGTSQTCQQQQQGDTATCRLTNYELLR